MENKIMIRDLLGLKVEQRTEDAYFNATLLFQQWNENNPNKIKRYDKWLQLSQTKDFMIEIFKNDYNNILKINRMPINGKRFNFKELSNLDKNFIEKMLVKKKKSGDKKMDFWIHPYLFIDCCQYVSSEFKYQAIKMVSDELIKYRVDICNRYHQWREFLQNKLGAKDWDYSNTQKEMNKAVFGFHETNIRDKATEEQLKLMEQYEDTVYNMYDLGFIKDCKDVRNALKIFQEKNFPKK